MSLIAIRDYQEQALSAVESARASGRRTALVVQPTGTGKTITFSELIRRWNVPTLVMSHREELLTQARDKLQMLWPEADVGLVGAGYEEAGHRITVASVQAISRPKRLAQLTAQGVELLIIDEAHHTPATTYQRVIGTLEAGQQDGPFLLGVTATPDRADGKGLDAIYGPPAYTVSLPTMVQQGFLCDLRGILIQTATDLDTLKSRAGDFAEEQLAAAVNTTIRNEQIVEAYREHADGRMTLVFAVNVQHAYALAECFRAQEIEAAALNGETPRDERQRLLRDYAAGRLRVLCNVGVLTEGFDAPETACVILARPTQSRALYVQMVGRGTRPSPSKTDCLVLDIGDNTTRHSLITLPTLIGRKGYDDARTAASDVSDNASDDDDDEYKQPDLFSLRDALNAELGPSGRLVAREVDLLERRFPWRSDGVGNYRVPFARGGGSLWLVLKDTGYIPGIVWPDGHKQQLAVHPVTLDWAQALAEHAGEMVRQGRMQLVDERAAWRNRPATDKQLFRLRQLKIKLPRDQELTCGEASRLIAEASMASTKRR